MKEEKPIVFFDGVCNLCNAAVQFIIRHDPSAKFMFASLQSARGMEAQKQREEANGQILDSFIVYYKGMYYTKADAALKLFVLLGGWTRILAVGYIIPRFVRNAAYDFVARSRYKWFGKSDSCMIPTPELKSRFLS